jgi:hypothetical protein
MSNDSKPNQDKHEVINPVKYVSDANSTNSAGDNKPASDNKKAWDLTGYRIASKNRGDDDSKTS